jgi:hypothetical protein
VIDPYVRRRDVATDDEFAVDGAADYPRSVDAHE